MDRFRPQPTSLSYYVSDYSITPAIPLLYVDGPELSASGQNQTARPVPLIDLFPVFAASSLVNSSTPVPIVEVCSAGWDSGFSEAVPIDAVSGLSVCAQDKCHSALSQVSETGATFDVLFSAANRVWEGVTAQQAEHLAQHFNSYNELEECLIRQCPLEYSVAHSSYCIPLKHPFFVQRNIFLPSWPAQSSSRVSPNTTLSAFGGDLGIRLPALPVGFPCDHQRTDQSLGTLVPEPDVSYDKPHGWWDASTFPTGLLALVRRDWSADDPLRGRVHTWIMKSSLLRGFEALGTTYASQLRAPFGVVPANVYSLGHCPAATRNFTGSKLSGEACTSSLECVFSLCVDGKCGSAAMGKQLTVDRGLDFVGINPRYWAEHQVRKHIAAIVMWAAVGGVAALVVLRAAQLWVWSWIQRTRQQGGFRTRRSQQPTRP